MYRAPVSQTKGPPVSASQGSVFLCNIDTALFLRVAVKIKWEILAKTLGGDPAQQTWMKGSSLLSRKGHQAVPGCLREVSVCTLTRVSFTAGLHFTPLWGVWREGTSRIRMEMPYFPGYPFSHLCWALNLLAFGQRVFFTRNKPSPESLLSCKPGKMILFPFPFWAKNNYLCHMRYTRNWQCFP